MKLFSLVTAAALVVAQYFIWIYAPVEEIMGLVQKIFYYHLPLAWWALISFFVTFLASSAYIVKREDRYDRVAGAAAEIGVLFSGLALVTGSLWARSAWNVWWTWDPRLSTTLIMWFVYAAYLVLRTSPMSVERRSLVCAVLGIIAFLDVPLVFYSARMWRSIHPAVFASKGGGMEPEMWHAVIVSLVAIGCLWAGMLSLRVRQLKARDIIDAKYVYDDFQE